MNEGYEVHVIAEEDEYSTKLIDLGFHFHPISVNNNTKNPINDLGLIFKYLRTYKKINPDIILHNAIKPNIYGTIAAGILRIPIINNISGLGTLFIKKSFSTKIASFLYRISQKFATIVFFQNPNDRSLFIENKLIKEDKTRLIPGSGVDTNRFSPKRFSPSGSDRFTFLFVGRLLFDKGIREYVEAAKEIKNKFSKVVFNVLGPRYQDNSTSISEKDLKTWIQSNLINYLGNTDEVEIELAKADCVVLPSYREGLSKVLIEASSMALPIVTTNVPGCKDVVVDGITGFLCKPKDAKDLKIKMEKMISLPVHEREEMGKKARKRAIDIFDVKKVVAIYYEAIRSIINKVDKQ